MSQTLYWEEPPRTPESSKSIQELRDILSEYRGVSRYELDGIKITQDDLSFLEGVRIGSTYTPITEDVEKLIKAVNEHGYVLLSLY